MKYHVTLTDGQLGDSTGADGRIVDPGGPALRTTPTGEVGLAYAGGSRWSQGFRDTVWVDGLGHQAFGFAAEANPWIPLPWANLDKVSLRFDRPLTVALQDLIVSGAGGTYPVTRFAYDERTRTATWTLGRALTAGYATLQLAERVTGVPLSVPLTLLPGDANRDGRVDAVDLRQVKSRHGTSISAPGSGPRDYSPFHDLNGDGRINVLDEQLVRANYLKSLRGTLAEPLPPARVAAPTPARTAAITRGLFVAKPVLG
jgi:hypothetical protein